MNVFLTLFLILKHFSNIQKLKILLILSLNFIVSALELLAITAVFPFIVIILNPENIFNIEFISKIIEVLSLDKDKVILYFNNKNIILFNLFLILAFFTIKSILLSIIMYFQLLFDAKIALLFKEKVLNKILNFENKKKIYYNSSEFIRRINNDTNDLVESLNSYILIINEIVFLFLSFSILLAISFKITISTFIFFSFFGFFIFILLKKFLYNLGKKRLFYWTKNYEILQSIFNSLVEIKLLAKQNFFIKDYILYAKKFEDLNIKRRIIPKLQKIFSEWLILILIIVIIFVYYLKFDNLKDAIPYLALFFLIGIRIVPSLNKFLNLFQTLKVLQTANIDTLNLLNSSTYKRKSKLNKINKINLNKVEFKYGDKKIFENINFTIKKNDKIGIVGENGSGKTTLIYLLLGIVKPSKGIVSYNNDKKNIIIHQLQNLVGFVPQNVYLFNDTILKNIAIGEVEPDKVTLNKAMKTTLINKNKFNPIFFNIKNIGENGLKLSGGQRQRVSIARALYQNPDILIFDESTSALDPVTEEKIIKKIFDIYKDKIIIFISHKRNSLKYCKKIYSIKDKKIILIKN